MKIKSHVLAGLLSLVVSSQAFCEIWHLEYRGKVAGSVNQQIKPRSAFKSFYSHHKQLIDIIRIAERELGFKSETTCYYTKKDPKFPRKMIEHEYGYCEILNSHILIKKNTRYICSVGMFSSSFIPCSEFFVDLQDEEVTEENEGIWW